MAGVGVFDPVWSRSPAQCLLKVDCELLGGGVVWFSNRPGHRPKVRPALTVKACDNRPNPWGPKGVPHQISGNLPPPPSPIHPVKFTGSFPFRPPAGSQQKTQREITGGNRTHTARPTTFLNVWKLSCLASKSSGVSSKPCFKVDRSTVQITNRYIYI